MRRAVCGMRRAACGVRRAACGVRRAACGVWHAVCGVRRAACAAASGAPVALPEWYSQDGDESLARAARDASEGREAVERLWRWRSSCSSMVRPSGSAGSINLRPEKRQLHLPASIHQSRRGQHESHESVTC